jgi:glyoxylase-like metal-dependent hydrolase (beta-lactamase superfamily II)
MITLEQIRWVTAANPGYMTLEGTNQYLLGKDEMTVIDVALESPANINAIVEQSEAMGGKRIEKILLTHIHRDHTGGALALKKRCGAKIGIFRGRAGTLGDEDFVYGDSDTIPYDGGNLRVVHTPGHESGHCCFLEPEEQILFTGDHILGRGTTVVSPGEGDNMTLYLQSLERLLPLKMRLMLPGHGPAIKDPYGKVREYLEHRKSREREILGALKDGLDTIPAITGRIYAGHPPALLTAARRSVEAHLIKLGREGRVRQTGDHYFSR